MLRLQASHIENYVLWKNGTLNFEPGITFIRGENRSGKSLLINAVSATMWGIENAVRGTDAAIWPKGAKNSLSFTTGKKTQWELFNSGSKVTLSKNEAPLKLPGKTAAFKELRKHIPITKELWDSTVVLSGLDRHFLTKASPSQRADWFASVFGIDAPFEAVLKELKPKHAEAKIAMQTLSVLKAELSALRIAKQDQNPQFSAKDCDKRYLLIETQISKLHARCSELASVVGIVRSIEELKQQMKAKLPKESVVFLRKKSAALHRKKSAIEAYDTFITVSSGARRRIAEGEARLSKLVNMVPGTVVELKHLSDTLMRVSVFSDRAEDQWTQEAGYRKSAEQLAQLKKPKHTTVQLEVMRHGIVMRIQQLRDTTTTVCSQCGSKLTGKHRKRELVKVLKDLERVERELLIAAKYEKLRKEADKVTLKAEPTKLHPLVQSWRNDVDKQIGVLEEMMSLQSKLSEAKLALKEIGPAPEKVAGDVPAISEKLQVIGDKLEALSAHKARQEQLSSMQLSLPVKYRVVPSANALNAELTEKTEKLNQLRSKHAMYRDIVTRHKVYFEQIIKLKKRIKDVRVVSDQLPMLEVLMEAYGRNGLRMEHLKTLISAFEQLLNDNLSLMWKEETPKDQPRFSLFLTDKGILIKLFRKGTMTDLSTLSGSEEKVWKLLAAYALIKLLPDKMRCDTIVLDEMEANMSSQLKARMARSLLPVFVDAGLKVVVVTPSDVSEFPVPFDRAFTVESKNNVSRLLLGNR